MGEGHIRDRTAEKAGQFRPPVAVRERHPKQPVRLIGEDGIDSLLVINVRLLPRTVTAVEDIVNHTHPTTEVAPMLRTPELTRSRYPTEALIVRRHGTVPRSEFATGEDEAGIWKPCCQLSEACADVDIAECVVQGNVDIVRKRAGQRARPVETRVAEYLEGLVQGGRAGATQTDDKDFRRFACVGTLRPSVGEHAELPDARVGWVVLDKLMRALDERSLTPKREQHAHPGDIDDPPRLRLTNPYPFKRAEEALEPCCRCAYVGAIRCISQELIDELAVKLPVDIKLVEATVELDACLIPVAELLSKPAVPKAISEPTRICDDDLVKGRHHAGTILTLLAIRKALDTLVQLGYRRIGGRDRHLWASTEQAHKTLPTLLVISQARWLLTFRRRTRTLRPLGPSPNGCGVLQQNPPWSVTMDIMNVSHQPPLSEEQLRWIEHVHQLEYLDHAVPRRTGAVAMALAMLDRELPMSSRQIASFARMGHETVRRGADALTELGLIDRHRRPRLEKGSSGTA